MNTGIFSNYKLQREELLARIAQELELDETRKNKMETAYNSVYELLKKESDFFKNLEILIYPQGSAKIGTTVKPINGEDFDLDTVLHIYDPYYNHKPKTIYDALVKVLENDGYWLVQEGGWVSFPSMNYVFMQNHKLDVSSSTNWYNGNFIIIDGARAYYHFDVGKTVLLSKDISNTITSSNLISTNSGYKTILGFSNPIVGEGEMGYSAGSSNRILVFNPKYQTSKQDLSSKTNSWVEDFNFIYKWPMEEHKKGLNTHTHDAANTATPEGNL